MCEGRIVRIDRYHRGAHAGRGRDDGRLPAGGSVVDARGRGTMDGAEAPMETFRPIEPNPYVVGNPIRDRAMFFGRHEDLRFLHDRLDTDGRETIVLCGGRRSGKTSILLQVMDGRLGERFLPVLVDMQQLAEVRGDALFWRAVALRILDRLREEGLRAGGLRVPSLARPPEDAARPGAAGDLAPVEQDGEPGSVPEALDEFRRFLDDTCSRLRGRKLVLLVDEYEIIEEMVQKGLLTTGTVLLMAAVLDSPLPVSFVFAGSRRIQERDPEVWRRLMGKALHRRISFLALADAERLVRDPVRGRLTYDLPAVRSILRLTAGHPFYTQVVCQALVDRLNEEQRSYCDADDVEAVVEHLVDNPLPQLVYWWKGLPALERILAAVVAHLADGPDACVSAEEIDAHLRARRREYGVETRVASVRGGLESMVEHEELEAGADRATYRFRVDLVRRWVHAEHPVWEAVHEAGTAGPDGRGSRWWRDRHLLRHWGFWALIAVTASFGLAVGLLLGPANEPNGRTRGDSPPGPPLAARATGPETAAGVERLRQLEAELAASVRAQEAAFDRVDDLEREVRAITRDDPAVAALHERLAEARREAEARAAEVDGLELRLRVARSLAAKAGLAALAAGAAPAAAAGGCPEPGAQAGAPASPPLAAAAPSAAGPGETAPAGPAGAAAGDPGEPSGGAPEPEFARNYRLVRGIFAAQRDLVAMCTQDRQGAAMVEVIVDGGTGRIEEISVGGDFRGESRVCIEEAIRRLVFPPLSGRRERLHYVYEFRAPRSPQ